MIIIINTFNFQINKYLTMYSGLYDRRGLGLGPAPLADPLLRAPLPPPT